MAWAVELDRHQTASLLRSIDETAMREMTLSIKPISRHFWIWSEVPAVTLEIDQQISFLIAFLGWSRSWVKASNTPLLMAT